MINYLLQIRFKLLSKTGRLPGATRYEIEQENLKERYDQFAGFADSDELRHFLDLEETVTSLDFKDKKKLIKNYRSSPEYDLEKEYKKLRKSHKIRWYLKTKNSNISPKSPEKWKLVFSDDFSNGILDHEKWLTSYYWGEKMLKKNYSLASDDHFYAGDANCTIEKGVLSLITKKENVEGLAWDMNLGFHKKMFNYTAGMINTGNHFRQLYGAFEAKIRLHARGNVFNAFSMISEQGSVPHIDICRFTGRNSGEIRMSHFWNDAEDSNAVRKNYGKVSGIDFSRGFFIFRLEWYPGKLVWKINGVTVKIEKNGVPEAPMYLMFSSGVENEFRGDEDRSKFDIEWVKCYELV